MKKTRDLNCEAWLKGKWIPLNIDMVLSSAHLIKRCIECSGEVRPHAAGPGNKPRAHFEHLIGHEGCSLGHYFGGQRTPHPTPARADNYYIFNIGSPSNDAWWRRHLSMGILTAGFLGKPGDQGEKKLTKMSIGDWVIAYAKGHGAVGAGRVGTQNSYKLTPTQELSVDWEGDHRHRRDMDWLYYVESVSDAVPFKDLNLNFRIQTQNKLADRENAQRIVGLLAAKSSRETRVTGDRLLTIFSDTSLPEEIANPSRYAEGATKTVFVNRYERDPKARRKCIEHYGTKCGVCSFDFSQSFGTLGKDFIHVHHLVPLSQVSEEYRVDPVQDMRPVCPNCHAMLHRLDNPSDLEELKRLLKKQPNSEWL